MMLIILMILIINNTVRHRSKLLKELAIYVRINSSILSSENTVNNINAYIILYIPYIPTYVIYLGFFFLFVRGKALSCSLAIRETDLIVEAD